MNYETATKNTDFYFILRKKKMDVSIFIVGLYFYWGII
jgi:hypothetical protein